MVCLYWECQPSKMLSKAGLPMRNSNTTDLWVKIKLNFIHIVTSGILQKKKKEKEKRKKRKKNALKCKICTGFALIFSSFSQLQPVVSDLSLYMRDNFRRCFSDFCGLCAFKAVTLIQGCVSPGHFWQCLGTFLIVTTWEVLLAFNE